MTVVRHTRGVTGGPYDVALSFSSAQRDYVLRVAEALDTAGLSVFYDAHHEVDLWGDDLNERLLEVYGEACRFVVMFISAEYAAGGYTTVERRAAFSGQILHGTTILPVRFDETEIDGLNPLHAYLRVGDKTPEQLADAIIVKVREPSLPAPLPAPAAAGAAAAEIGRIVGALPPHQPRFRARDDDMADLLSSGGDRHEVVHHRTICGEPGVGKTQLAAEVAYQRLEAGTVDLVGFVVADSRRSAVDGMVAVGAALGVDRVRGESSGKLVRRVVAELESSTRRWLLIFDNAEVPADLDHLVPRVGKGQVIVTTRSRTLASQLSSQRIELETLPVAEAVGLLREGLSDADAATDADLETLVGMIDGLPYHLLRAAALLDRGWTVEELAVQLPERSAGGGESADGGLWDQTLELLSAPARRILGICAVCAPDSVPVWALAATDVDPPLTGANEAVDELIDWSLAKPVRTDGRRSVSIHRLLHRSVGVAVGVDAIRDAVGLIEAALPVDATLATAWSTLRLLEPHVRALSDLLDPDRPDPDRPDPDRTNLAAVAWLLDRLATGRQYSGDYHGAVDLFERARRNATSSLGGPDEDETSLAVWSDLGIAYWYAGRNAESVTVFEGYVPRAEEVLGALHPETLNGRHNLANAYLRVEQVDKAIELYVRTLDDRTDVLGETHRNTLTTRAALAFAYGMVGRYEDALPLSEHAVDALTRTLGASAPLTLAARNNLANVLLMLGRIEEAIGRHEGVLAERIEVLPPDHPDTLVSRHSLAEAYRAAGRLAEAAQLLEVTVSARATALGADHPLTVASRRLLAAIEEEGRAGHAASPPDA